jgi:hypothetical protein
MFIIPYHAGNNKEWEEKRMITGTIEGLFTQTDGDWNAFPLINGHSKGMVSTYLSDLKGKYYPKIDIISLDRIVPPGVARNPAIM